MQRSILAFLFALLFAATAAAQVNNPGVRTQGAVAANDCVKFVNAFTIASNGAACAGATAPGGAANTLQFNNAGAFGGVTSSAVSGANITLGGLLHMPVGTAALPSVSVNDANATGIYSAGAGSFDLSIAGVRTHAFDNAGYALISNTAKIQFGSSLDITIARNAAGAVDLYNGTNATQVQAFNTRTSATIYEAGIFSWQNTANVLTIGTVAAGGGTTRNMQFVIGGVNKLDFGITTAAVWTASVPIASTSTLKTGGFTVAGLPAAGTAGRRAYVTDQAAACVAAGAALTGGGAVVCPVFDNGAAWVGE